MGALPQETWEPGLYPGISRAAYESIPAINISTLEHFDRSAAHARERMIHPPAPTAAMNLGTAVHMAILEPQRFDAEYVAAPKCDRRTREGKAAWAEFEIAHAGKSLLPEDEHEAVRGMRDAVWAHPIAAEILRAGHNEVCVVWRDRETGLLCKGLIDHIGTHDGWTVIADVKKTQDARPQAFTRSIKTLNYGPKAAWYLDGCNAVAPRERRFVWIAVEEQPPHGVRLYEPDEEALSAGRVKYQRWLWLYAEAIRTNEWPSYEASISPLTARDTEWNQ